MVCLLHNYDFKYHNKHFFAKNEWKKISNMELQARFIWLTKVNFSHLTPSFYFEYNKTNYSFKCAKCNKSIGSTFETKNNVFPNYYMGANVHLYGKVLGIHLDDYFCAFMANNNEWFLNHKFHSNNNSLCK